MEYTLHRCRAYFTRVGYELRLFNADGTPYTRLLSIVGRDPRVKFPDSDPIRFWGNDGRKVRAEALACARAYGATKRREG